MSDLAETRRELEEKIFSKRQQIDFEQSNLDYEALSSPENHENPDIMEEAKNFSDPVESTLDKDDLRSLSKAEKELNSLLKQLEDLDKA